MKKAFVFLTIFLFVAPVPLALAEDWTFLGKLRVASGEKPAACFSLSRDGEDKTPVHGMKVHLGDRITVKPGKQVWLRYLKSGYQDKLLSGGKRYVARLPEELVKAIEEEEYKPVKTHPTRDPKSLTACFPLPGKLFNLSPWPRSGTTVLAGAPLLIRWVEIEKCPDDVKIDLCNEVTLVIAPMGSDKPRRIPMKAGELKPVEDLEPGRAYQWFVEKDGKAVSEKYRFEVLDAAISGEIQADLEKLGRLYKDPMPLLHQARYLQYLSDVHDHLDLYADSLRLLKAFSGKRRISEAIMEPVYQHCWPE